MNVTFINPPHYKSKYKFIGVIAPPLGIGYMAAMLERNNIPVDILDASALDLTYQEIEQELLERKPDLVALTALTPTIGTALETAAVVKKILPNTIVAIGGYHPTFTYNEIIENPNIDIVIRGEGENTIVELAQALENNTDLSNIDGLVFKDKNDCEKTIVTNNREVIQDLDTLPYPALHLMPMDKYRMLDVTTHMTTMITTRGCPNQCSFCSSAAMHGRRIRSRSTKNIVDEIEYLKNNYDIDTIAFLDDTFTLNKRKVKEICNEIMARNLNIMWGCTARVDNLDEELLDIMKESGCITIFLGVESADQQSLDEMHKGTTIEKIQHAFKISREKDIRTIASVAMGMPGDTKESINKTIKFVHDLKPNYAIFSLATPYPGTRFYKEAFEKNLIKVKDWSKYTLISPILETVDCSMKDLRRLQTMAFIKFYLRPGYIISQVRQDGMALLKAIGGVIKTAIKPNNDSYMKDYEENASEKPTK